MTCVVARSARLLVTRPIPEEYVTMFGIRMRPYRSLVVLFAGLAVSLTYLYHFDRWQWRVKAAAVRRFVRAFSPKARSRRINGS